MASNFVSENGIKKIGEWVKGKINSLSDVYLNKTDASSTYLNKTDASSTYLNKTDASSTYLNKTDASSTYLNKIDESQSDWEQIDITSKDYIKNKPDLDLKADITVNERVADIEETYSEYYYKITEDTVDENNYLNYYYLNNYEITSTSSLEEYDNSITYYEKINRVSEAITEEDKKYYLEDGKYYDISSIQNYEYNDEITYYNIDLTISSYNKGSIIIVKYNYNNRVIRTSDIEELKNNINQLNFFNLDDYNINTLIVDYNLANFLTYTNNELVPNIYESLSNNKIPIIYSINNGYYKYYFISYFSEIDESKYSIQLNDWGQNPNSPNLSIYNLFYNQNSKELYVYNASISLSSIVTKNYLLTDNAITKDYGLTTNSNIASVNYVNSQIELLRQELTQ